jgi:hypothetical protein
MEGSKKFEWRKRRTPGESIGDTFTIVKEYFKPLASSVFLICGPVILLSSFFYKMYGQQTFQPTSMSFSNFGYDMFKNIIFSIGFFFISSSLLSAVVLNFLKLVIEGNEKPAVSQVWDSVKKNIGKIFLISFLLSIVFVVMILIAMVFVSFLGVFSIVIMVLGFIVLGFYLITKLNLSYAAAIIDDLSATEAMGRSWYYTSGYFWSTAGVWILAYLVTSCIAFVVYIPAYIMTMTAVFTKNLPEVINTPLFKAFSILYSFTSLIISTIILISMSMHYLNLEERMEGTGLMEKIDSLGIENDNRTWGEEKF